jgi:hypothetical protein
MSTHSMPDIAPLPDFLQAKGPITLTSIRKSRKATSRGEGAQPVHYESTAFELEVYLNQAVFDFSMRISQIERHLKSEERSEATPPEIVSQLGEMLRELKFCSDIGNFAISQLA